MLMGFAYSPVDSRVVNSVGQLYIPSQNINEPIYFSKLENQQWDRSVWDNGNVAWLDQTGWIDSEFNTVLVSHTDGPLHDIIWLAVGDIIYISDDNYVATYVVTVTVIQDYNDLSVTYQSGGPIMSMTICWQDDQRYTVQAERISIESH
jgi:sortase (surface protein transpeptidase)